MVSIHPLTLSFGGYPAPTEMVSGSPAVRIIFRSFMFLEKAVCAIQWHLVPWQFDQVSSATGHDVGFPEDRWENRLDTQGHVLSLSHVRLGEGQ